jgi:hypothetical protein
MSEPPYILAHKHSIYHREEILRSTICGCFYCLAIFPPNEITEWIDVRDGQGTTAMCPYCDIDSVIGDASGFPITKAFLKEMNEHWF